MTGEIPQLHQIDIDKAYIRELVNEYGAVPTIYYIRALFGNEMNPNIDDYVLRLMVWQLTDAFENMEKMSKKTFNNVNEIKEVQLTSKDPFQVIIAKQLIGGLNSLKSYIKPN